MVVIGGNVELKLRSLRLRMGRLQEILYKLGVCRTIQIGYRMRKHDLTLTLGSSGIPQDEIHWNT